MSDARKPKPAPSETPLCGLGDELLALAPESPRNYKGAHFGYRARRPKATHKRRRKP